ncbi:hypothetical protein KCU81_g10088, partial [Aureobasidium melanogenum]|uniref:C2H2-type domain-containing protein n=1 Tax=Aureobasidium melanogenum (strain CBS 110374) TaxID=1043003 RepID=A0A074W888_AURM1
MDPLDPFDPRSIARHNTAQTSGQRLQREQEWGVRLNSHLSDDQLHHWITVAEELLAHGFDGNWGQTQRLARSIRTALLTTRGLEIEPSPVNPPLGPLMQALRNTSQPAQPAPSPLIQSLVNARDFQPSAAANQAQQNAEESQAPAGQASQHAEETQAPAGESDQRAQQPQENAEDSQSPADESPHHAQQPRTTAEESHQHAQQSPGHDEEPDQDVHQSPRHINESPKHDEEPDYDVQQSPGHAHGSSNVSDDDGHALDFVRGTKRTRRILSDSESGSTTPNDAENVSSVASHSGPTNAAQSVPPSSTAPAVVTRADPIATTAVPSQATIAPIITFGSAAPTNSVVSNKSINRRTANDYAGTNGGMVYSCPVHECKQPINEAWTIDKFYKHLDDSLHTDYFFQKDMHICPFGCQKGFLNDFALHRHIQQSSCKESEDLSAEIKTCKQCNVGTKFPDIIGALDHLADDHDNLTSRIGSPYVCVQCDVGFPTKELLWGHLALVSQRSDGHPAVTKARNMWYPAPDIVRS